MFSLSFRTDNAAFCAPDDSKFPEIDGRAATATEVARILREVAKRLERGELEGAARDLNGNTVGAFELNGRNPRD